MELTPFQSFLPFQCLSYGMKLADFLQIELLNRGGIWKGIGHGKNNNECKVADLLRGQ